MVQLKTYQKEGENSQLISEQIKKLLEKLE